MKSETSSQIIERFNIGEETAFSIDASSGHAFGILSSGIYKNKIGAIIRELSCNAHDAHVASGNDEPFVVHLPNTLAPFFRVTDNGLGLSDEDIRHHYTTYFASNKTHTNDLIGGLGLGSKSPFCLVDNFSISSRFNGTVNTYTAFIADNGCPSITLMDSRDTSEPNGLTVTVPVRSSDFARFKEMAAIIFKYFSKQPKIEGGQINIRKAEYLFEGNDWAIRETWCPHENRYIPSTAIMGNVAYPIDTEALPVEIRKFYKSSIDIRFPIGALKPVAGREDLSYTPSTVKTLVEYANRIQTEIRGVFQKKIDEAKTTLDAYNVYASTLSIMGGGGGDYTYRGNSLPKWKNGYTSMNIDLSDYPGAEIFRSTGTINTPKISKLRGEEEDKIISLSIVGNLVCVVDDQKDLKTIARHINGIIVNSPSVWVRGLILRNTGDASNIPALLDKLTVTNKHQNIIYSSSIPDAQRKRYAAQQSRQFLLLDNCSDELTEKSWDEKTIDLSLGGLFVSKRGSKIMHGANSSPHASALIKLARQNGIITTPIYGFTNKSVISSGPWIDAMGLLQDLANKLNADPKMAAKIEHARAVAHRNTPQKLKTIKFMANVAEYLPKSHPVSKFSKDYLEGLAGLARFVVLLCPKPKYSSRNFLDHEKILEKYPLFSLEAKPKLLAEYMLWQDRRKGMK